MEAIVQANEVAGANTLLLRRTFSELETSLLQYFRRDIPRDLWASFNESKHVVTWHNGSTTRFGFCESENDVYQYQGAEFLFIGIDELTMFKLFQWLFLTSRNRCPVPNSFSCMAGTSNPGNIGHGWVKGMFIDKRVPQGMDEKEYNAEEYEFIPALVWDNPIYAKDEAYLKVLRSLPTHLRKAFLEGDWDVIAGAYFDIFNRAVHVVRAESVGIQEWWPKWVSIDWGFEHEAAAYWHTTHHQDAGTRHTTYREIVENHLAPRVLAERVVNASHGSSISQIFLSPDAFAKRTDEDTIAEQMTEVFRKHGFPDCSPADNDRIGGWMLMYQLLQSKEWQIADSCPRLIESLPTLTRDPKHIEDILKMDGDDAADAARYGLKSRLGEARKPVDVQIEEQITTWKQDGRMSEPTTEMMYRRVLEQNLNRARMPQKFAYRGLYRPRHG